MNWHAFFAVIATASGVGAWIALMYALKSETGNYLAQLYGLTVLLVLICATAAGLSC